MTPHRRSRPIPAALVALALAAGCRSEMYEQPKLEPQEPSPFFADGAGDRPLVVGTIARGELRADEHLYAGKVRGKDAEEFPFAVDRAVLERGRERYVVFCSPCHGGTGDGRGMIVRRGLSPPPSFHSDELRKKPVGHYFDVVSNGYGAMYPYAYRVPVRDRWAIIAYIRALQLSRDARAADLPASDRAELARPGGAAR